MWISWLVTVPMMYAVGGDPSNRPSLKRQRAAGRKKILGPLRYVIAAVCQEAVVTHPDAEVDCEHINNGSDDEVVQLKKKSAAIAPI